MNKTKKIVSLVLAVMMVVSMMSVMAVSVSAAEYKAILIRADGTVLNATTGRSAILNMKNGDTVKLLDNAFLSEETALAVLRKDVGTATIDLNGFSIGNSIYHCFYVKSGSTLNLMNSSDKEGVVYTESDYIKGDSAIRNDGTVNVGKNVKVEGRANNSYGIYNNDNGIVNVNGGTVIGRGAGIVTWANTTVNVTDGLVKGDDAFAICGNGTEGYGGYTINVSGGEVSSTSSDGAAIYSPNSGVVNVTGGTVTGATAIYAKAGQVNISGGTLSATKENGTGYTYKGSACAATGDAVVIENCDYPAGAPTASITGGTFNVADKTKQGVASYVAQDDTTNYNKPTQYPRVEGFVSGGVFNTPVDTKLVAEGVTVVGSDTGVQTVGHLITTEAELIEAAKTDGQYILGNDITTTGTLNVNAAFNLEGNGYTITTSSSPVVAVNTTDAVVLKDVNLTSTNANGRGITIYPDSSNVTLDGCEIKATQRGITYDADDNQAAVLNVIDSKIINTRNDQDYTKEYYADNNSRGISFWQLNNATVNIIDSTIAGFAYDINLTNGGPGYTNQNVKVTAKGSTFYGRAAINNSINNAEFVVDNCNINGINNQSGPSEGFATIVSYEESHDCTFEITNSTSVSASYDETGLANPKAIESFLGVRGKNITVTVSDTSYTDKSNKGGIVEPYNPNEESNTVLVKSGTFNCAIPADKEKVLQIAGGSFSEDVDIYAVDGYVGVKNADGTYTIAVDTNPLNGVAEIVGYQNKIEGTTLDGNDINTKGVRILTKVDKAKLADFTEYGYVVAKVNDSIAQPTANFSRLTADGNNGQKVINCKGTHNYGVGAGENYVTLAVNGMEAGNKVAVRFYAVDDNGTYYSYYVGTARYNGIIATMTEIK